MKFFLDFFAALWIVVCFMLFLFFFGFGSDSPNASFMQVMLTAGFTALIWALPSLVWFGYRIHSSPEFFTSQWNHPLALVSVILVLIGVFAANAYYLLFA